MKSPRIRRITLLSTIVTLWCITAIWKGLGRPPLLGELGELLSTFLNSLPSFVGGLTVPLGFLAAHPHPTARQIGQACLWSLPVLILAEVVEIALPGSRFDWWDLLFSVLGIGLIGLGLRFLWARDVLANP